MKKCVILFFSLYVIVMLYNGFLIVRDMELFEMHNFCLIFPRNPNCPQKHEV